MAADDDDEASCDRPYSLLISRPTLRVRHSLCRPAEAVLWLLGAVGLIIMIATRMPPAWQPSAIMMLARGTILSTSSNLPVCLLLHGAGMDTETPIEASMRGYWGPLQERLQWVCSTVVFMYEDTLRVGWEDAALQERVCALVRDAAAIALAGTPAPLVIFSHSLGSLLLAGALEAGRCELPAEAAWYSAGAPWQGSRAAEKLPQICSVDRSLGLEGVAAHAASVMLRVLAVRECYIATARAMATARVPASTARVRPTRGYRRWHAGSRASTAASAATARSGFGRLTRSASKRLPTSAPSGRPTTAQCPRRRATRAACRWSART